jgi:hypothetical protein
MAFTAAFKPRVQRPKMELDVIIAVGIDLNAN